MGREVGVGECILIPNMKPIWLKKKLSPPALHSMKAKLRGLDLHTVCEEARCPNISECFCKGTATVMIMGDICTRSCKFCAVKTGKPAPLNPKEPQNVAALTKKLGLKHVVITSVDRDDLPDLGAGHFAKTINTVKKHNPSTTIEVLTPDFQGRPVCLDEVCQANPQIFNHNMETVRRLTPKVRSAAKYDRSLDVLKWVKEHYPQQKTKSGIMLGLGETKEEVIEAMRDLYDRGCDLLTLGQYLQPTKKHLPVAEYVHPDRFKEYEELGQKIGFKAIFSGPFVRSSYLAEEMVGEGGKRGMNSSGVTLLHP